MYGPLKRAFGVDEAQAQAMAKKLSAGVTSGAVGSVIANPLDVLKVTEPSATFPVIMRWFLIQNSVKYWKCC